MTVESNAVTGPAAAAILLMLLDESEAAAILKCFEPGEVKTLATAMFAVSEASEREIDGALDQFVQRSRRLASLSVRAAPRIRSVINAAVGNIRADNILSEIAPQSSAAALDLLRWMEVPAIAALLANEHPQVGAIIIAVLAPEIAARVLEDTPDDVQADLLYRAARLTSVSSEAIADLEALLLGASQAVTQTPKMRVGGKAGAAKIVNSMKKAGGERALRAVKKRDKQLGGAIEDEMFIFDNLITLDAKNLAAVLRAVDAGDLALALKGASDALADKMLGAMSARAAQSIRDDMADQGPAKRTDVEDAQKTIIMAARKLAEDGSISLGGASDDYV